MKIDEIITCGLPLITNNEELNIFHGQVLMVKIVMLGCTLGVGLMKQRLTHISNLCKSKTKGTDSGEAKQQFENNIMMSLS